MAKFGVLALAPLILAVGLSGPAWADRRGHGGSHGHSHGHYHGHHGHHGHGGTHFGFSFGLPLYWGGYPYDYYPYYRRNVYVIEPPPVYIQRQPPVYVQQPAAYWYYCQDPAGYYPYVQSCPTPWIKVLPQTP
jgi:hypothetical protein